MKCCSEKLPWRGSILTCRRSVTEDCIRRKILKRRMRRKECRSNWMTSKIQVEENNSCHENCKKHLPVRTGCASSAICGTSVFFVIITIMSAVSTGRPTPLSLSSSSNVDFSPDRQLKQQQLLALRLARPSVLNKRSEDEQEVAAVPKFNKYPASERLSFFGENDDRYEKADADPMAKMFIAPSSDETLNNVDFNSGVGCPKECECLNDYFICNRKHLSYVPLLPGYVQVIDFNGNKLNDSTVLQILNLPQLSKLILRRNQLKVIPAFQGLPALKHLNLAGNHIRMISNIALASLPNLKFLDLSRNGVHTIKANDFPSNNQLTQLLLNGNNIHSIEENAFQYLTNLDDLELNNNRLTILPNGVFKHLIKLRKLSLNNNRIEVNWSTFRGLQSLQRIQLQSNNIRALQDGIFHVMRMIETIKLDHNSITSLNRQGLFNLTKLQHLSLSNNSITSIEPDTWEFTQSLITLDLSMNNISELQPQHLDCLKRLKKLNLADNNIEYLHENTFHCVQNLEDLVLRRNLLSTIIEDSGTQPPFKVLQKLKKLDLYGNGLKQITVNSLAGLYNLEWLNVDGNDIAAIQSKSFEHMTRLQKLILRSSNLICDCELLWFRTWLMQYYNTVDKNPFQLVCGFPKIVSSATITSLEPEAFVCGEATPRPTLVEEPSNQLTVKGANISLECLASTPAGMELHSGEINQIFWKHNNRKLQEHSMKSSRSSGIVTETYIFHDNSTNLTFTRGNLMLYNVNYNSAGKYQCVISNRFGTSYSERFKLSIGILPTFLQVPSDVVVDSGETVRLVCSAIGDPQPEIALQKFGSGDFPAATERRLQVIREENAFLITNAKPADSGIYTCTAESPAGEIKINASLLVNDKPQPSIEIVHKEIVLGKSSVLECLIDGTSGININQLNREWFKDNKPFHITPTLDAERYYYTAERELLIIVNTQSVDAGRYRCELTDDSNIHLTIHMELIVVQEHVNRAMIVIVAAFVSLACIFIGSLIIWTILQCHKRKLHVADVNGSGLVLSTCDARAVAAGNNIMNTFTVNTSAAMSNGVTSLIDFESVPDTACRTYLRKSNRRHECLFLTQRPRSLAALEMSELNCKNEDFINEFNASLRQPTRTSCLIVTNSSNYEQLLSLQRSKVDERQGLLSEEGTNFGHSYWQRNMPQDLYNQQDHLSSKDSGTESDAAVKRSAEDVNHTLLIVDHTDSSPAAKTTNETRSSLTSNEWQLHCAEDKNSSTKADEKNAIMDDLDTYIGELVVNHPDEGGGIQKERTETGIEPKLRFLVPSN